MIHARQHPAVTLALAVGFTLLAGCATDVKPSTEVIVQPMPALFAGDPVYARIDWIDFHSHEVVTHINGYRHTLDWRMPNRAAVAPDYAIKAHAANNVAVARPLKDKVQPGISKVADMGRVSERNEEPEAGAGSSGHPGWLVSRAERSFEEPPEASSPAELDAWRNWCFRKKLSQVERDMITSTRPPQGLDLKCAAFHIRDWAK